MKLILARHGETLWNSEHRYQGHMDSGLTEKGKKEAMLVAEELKNEKIDFLYSSPLGRAMKTAREILKFHPGLKPIIKDELKEMNYGEFEGRVLREIDETHPEWLIERKTNRYYATPPGGESYADLEKRAKPVIDEILSKDSVSLIVAHANINKAIIRLLMNFEPHEVNYIYQPNNCIYFIGKAGKGYSISYRLAGEGIRSKGYMTLD